MPAQDPLHRQFAQSAEYLIDHPPPQMMLWVLSELLRATVDMVTVIEARDEEEHRPQQSSLQMPLDDAS